jgi:PhzF family phenazine biosynthesis protein
MASYAFRLLNVFSTGGAFTGNPLCVFEDARGLDGQTMQALAKQFNLSETTFVLPSERANAIVRIYTPAYEMPFAGHPTVGTASVVAELAGERDAVTLEEHAGVIPVRQRGGEWTLQANAPIYRDAAGIAAAASALFGIEERDVLPGARFVNTGKEQLIVPLRSVEAVRAARPNPARLGDVLKSADDGNLHALIWATTGATTIEARFFFDQGTTILEDPATGSACANLGGWLLAEGSSPVRSFTIAQGAQTGRPSELHLALGELDEILVGGRVQEIGRGTIALE